MGKLFALVIGLMCLPLVVAIITDIPELPKTIEPTYHIVKVTTYTTDPKQTDSTPFITASGFKLNHKNPKKHRIIAVSRDIKRRLKFGERVKLSGIGKYSGIYVVHDVMNARFKNRIDILINPKDKPTMFKQAIMTIL